MSLKDRIDRLESKVQAKAAADAEPIEMDRVGFARSIGFEPDPWQQQMLTTKSKQVAVLCSRQVGKSTTAAVVALAEALCAPGSLILLVSPSLRQSQELFKKVRDNLDKMANPPRLREDNKLSLIVENKSRIVSLPENPGTVRGFSGVSLIIEDEAAWVPDEFNVAVRPMLATSGGRLMLLSTPFGKRGHLWEAWSNGGEAWERISIKATECPRIPPAFLEQERATMGEWQFRQEYLCEFVDPVNSFFSSEEVRRAVSDEVRPLFGEDGSEAAPESDEVKPLFPEGAE